MELKTYPSYKPSGVSILGDVPVHWEMRRLKSICYFAYGDSLTADMRADGDVPVYGSNGLVGNHSSANTMSPCIVIGRKGSFGKVNYVEEPLFAIDTTYFVDERYSRNNLRWLFYLLDWLRLDDVTKDSAIPGLGREETHQRLAPVPPLPEQAAIVRYLDFVDGRIRRYISARQKLVKLLEEQKQVLIHRSVTRGLNPNVRLNPSGVEWLGDVPAHWEVRRLKSICYFAYGDSLTADMRADGDVPVYGSNGLVGNHSSANTMSPCIVIGRKGSFGKVNFVEEPLFAIDTTYFVDERYSRNNLRWLFYLLGWLRLDDVTKDSTIPGLGREDTHQRLAPVPPFPEQAAIAEYLDKITTDIDTAIDCARRQIELLGEYRTRLIADVVTGQLEVRQVATMSEVDSLVVEDNPDDLLEHGVSIV